MQLIGITRETKLGQYDQKRDVGLEVANLTSHGIKATKGKEDDAGL